MPCGIASGGTHGCNAGHNCKRLTVEHGEPGRFIIKNSNSSLAQRHFACHFEAAQLAELEATVATATADVESIQDDVNLRFISAMLSLD